MSRPRRAQTARLDAKGTRAERWTFDADSASHRCSWPTARVAFNVRDDPKQTPEAQAIANAYGWLVNHPLGVEYAVRHVRDMHAAEAGRLIEEAE